jgi:hypothetical protein
MIYQALKLLFLSIAGTSPDARGVTGHAARQA